jgi:O-antigen/teichoic acid export membrane protein
MFGRGDSKGPAAGGAPSEDDALPPSLTQTTVRGMRLAGAGYVSSQVLNLLAYLVLVRLLTPKDFGFYAAGTLITGFGGLFAESGMLAALIKREDRFDEAVSTAFFSLLVTGVGLTLGSAAISPLIGLAFHSSEVFEVTLVLSGWLLIRALTIVPDALLQRQFSFVRRIIVDPLGVIAYAAASIPLAVSGAGVWAMVAGAYASIITQAVAAWVAVDYRPRLSLASFPIYRELASFARPLVAGEILRRLTFQIDTFMLGRFSGAAALGQYRNGLMLAQQPGNAFGSVAAYVILPAFARISSVPERIAGAARHAYWVTHSVIVPVSAACLPLGVPGAVILLGARWHQAGQVIAGLCGFVLGGTLLSISGELMKAVSQLRLQLGVQTVRLVLVAVTVTLTALLWGPVGVAIALSVSSFATAIYAMVKGARALGLPASEFLTGMVTPVIASAVMVVVMRLFDWQVGLLDHPELQRIILLVAEILIGALVYGIVLGVIDAPRRKAGLHLARRSWRRLGPRAAHGTGA